MTLRPHDSMPAMLRIRAKVRKGEDAETLAAVHRWRSLVSHAVLRPTVLSTKLKDLGENRSCF